jgi:hypothetical protein
MKRYFLIAAVALALGTGFGFALGIFVYPFWFLGEVASETVANRDQKTRVASGTFIHANPSDPVHWGKGGVELLDGPGGERLVYLQPDFEVGPGPRFHVYLVDRTDVRSNGDFPLQTAVDLGRLRAFKGSQVFPIPTAIDVAKVGSIVVWCKEFGVLITPADLVRS